MAGFWRKVLLGVDWTEEDAKAEQRMGGYEAPFVIYNEAVQFPHCDSLILHSPGVCEFCDRHPDWQAYREGAGIAFSDTDPLAVRELGLSPCPSIFHRPSAVRDQWPGNQPAPA